MSEKILVPVLGESISEATVSKWLKNKGDMVNADEGPSFGVAPAGTCTCRDVLARYSLPGSLVSRKLRVNVCAMALDSFITSPS